MNTTKARSSLPTAHVKPCVPVVRRAVTYRPRKSLNVVSQYSKLDVGDRVLAATAYMLPLLDALPYGRFMFEQYPYVARAMAPLGPLYALYTAIPFAPLIAFFALYSGVVNNGSMNRFIRYNAMQAVLLDILLIIPQLILSNLFKMPEDGSPTWLLMTAAYNTVFLFVMISVAYGMGASAVGQTPRLPLVAEAAEAQLRKLPGGF